MKDWKIIKWIDSYGASSGWQDIEDYQPVELEVTSTGRVVHENEKVVALAGSYAEATALTPEQANGIIVIPKVAIKEVISFSSFCRTPE